MALKLIYAVYCISGFVYGWLSRFVYGDIILTYSVILFYYQFRIKFMIKSWTLWELNILRKIHVVCDWIVSYFQNQIFGCGPLDPQSCRTGKGITLTTPHTWTKVPIPRLPTTTTPCMTTLSSAGRACGGSSTTAHRTDSKVWSLYNHFNKNLDFG